MCVGGGGGDVCLVSVACCLAVLHVHTVLDTDNLHFSEEFLKFPARADTDICADALGFSTRYCADFPKSLVKLSQFCYGFKDIRKYRKSRVDACDKMADHWLEPQR